MMKKDEEEEWTVAEAANTGSMKHVFYEEWMQAKGFASSMVGHMVV